MAKSTDEPLVCPTCFEKEVMEILCEKGVEYEDTHVTWSVLSCINCKSICFVGYYGDINPQYIGKGSDGEPLYRYDTWSHILYPQNFREFRDLPDNVERAYKSAQKVFEVDTNAFAVMIGRTLEFVCEDMGAKGDNLYNKLKDLAKKGKMPSTITDIATGIRLTRNVGAHAGANDVSKEEAIVIRKLCETMLEYLYEAPAMLKELEDIANKKK